MLAAVWVGPPPAGAAWRRPCGGPGCAAPAALRCAGCGAAFYCGESCARAAWRAGHRIACAVLASAAPPPLLAAVVALRQLRENYGSLPGAVALLREFSYEPAVVQAAAALLLADAATDTPLCQQAPAGLLLCARAAATQGSIGALRQVACALYRIAVKSLRLGSAWFPESYLAAEAPSTLVLLLRLPAVEDDSKTASSIIDLIGCLATYSELALAAFLDARAPALLIALLRLPAIRDNIAAIESIAMALSSFSGSARGANDCVLAGAPAALAALAWHPRVEMSAHAPLFISSALGRIISSDDLWVGICIEAGAAAALVKLSQLASARQSADSLENVAQALADLASIESGRVACLAAGAVQALAALAAQPVVLESSDAIGHVARAVANLCLTAGANSMGSGVAAAIAALAWRRAVWEDGDAAQQVARALLNLSGNSEGCTFCVAARAPQALAVLSEQPAVRVSGEALSYVCRALENLGSSRAGRAVWVGAVRRALAALASLPIAKGDAKLAARVARARASLGR